MVRKRQMMHAWTDWGDGWPAKVIKEDDALRDRNRIAQAMYVTRFGDERFEPQGLPREAWDPAVGRPRGVRAPYGDCASGASHFRFEGHGDNPAYPRSSGAENADYTALRAAIS